MIHPRVSRESTESYMVVVGPQERLVFQLRNQNDIHSSFAKRIWDRPIAQTDVVIYPL